MKGSKSQQVQLKKMLVKKIWIFKNMTVELRGLFENVTVRIKIFENMTV